MGAGCRDARDKSRRWETEKDGDSAQVVEEPWSGARDALDWRRPLLQGLRDSVRDPNPGSDESEASGFNEPRSTLRYGCSITEPAPCGQKQQPRYDEVDLLWSATRWDGQAADRVSSPVVPHSAGAESSERCSEQQGCHEAAYQPPRVSCAI